MTYQRLVNDALARILHEPLYRRMVSFAQQYTPELPGELIAGSFLSRLFNNDDSLHVLVELDDFKIVGHGIVEVQQAYGCNVVYCHQAYADKGKQSTLDEGIEYCEKLAHLTNAQCIVFAVSKHIRSLERKYNYKAVRTIMMKSADDIGEGNAN